jgi:alkanesulfonate monooxygenase SsuD/methylene tetrahydromethanopterin reductase-like flavin-dependent oxidoreductase (luciferase family)
VNVFDEIQFYVFNHHHYTEIPPDDERYPSTWVQYPNALFDPEIGHALYQRYMREMQLAEELGYDAVVLNEHHATTYSLTPATSVRAAWVGAMTKEIKILVSGVPINLSWPSRVAEEYAMLDVMTGGRMEYGFPLGTGMEYWSNAAAANPATARAKFREGLDIVLRAWTEDGPLRHDGEHFLYRYLNVWPKPFQKPRPKCYIVGSGSPETLAVAAELGTGYSVVFTPIAQQLKAFDAFRELCAEQGREVQPDELLVPIMVYVADTDEEAVERARPFIERFFSFFHRVPPKNLTPPGYLTADSFRRILERSALSQGTSAAFDDMLEIARVAVGSPETVADLLAKWAQDAGTSRLVLTFTLADMSEEEAMRNMTLFAEEVVPRLRARATAAVA